MPGNESARANEGTHQASSNSASARSVLNQHAFATSPASGHSVAAYDKVHAPAGAKDFSRKVADSGHSVSASSFDFGRSAPRFSTFPTCSHSEAANHKVHAPAGVKDFTHKVADSGHSVSGKSFDFGRSEPQLSLAQCVPVSANFHSSGRSTPNRKTNSMQIESNARDHTEHESACLLNKAGIAHDTDCWSTVTRVLDRDPARIF